MGQKALYQLSGKQILLVGIVSAFVAVGAVLLIINIGSFVGAFQTPPKEAVALKAKPLKGISDPAAVSDEQNSIEVYKTASPGVAFITTSARFETFFGEEFERESGNGSGSVIDANGHILTNYHVVEGASKLTVSFGGERVYPAKFIGGDPDTDLAVIKISPPAEGLTIIPMGDSSRLVVGQKVLAIGNPFGLDRTLTTGVISGLERPIRARNQRPIDAAIQTDASINPGNSGGPLLDKFGRMIGINSQILSPSGASAGVGFAVPVNTARRVIPQLIQFGEVRRPKLGAAVVSVEELSRRYRLPVEKGLLVRYVQPGGSAQTGGIRGFTRDGDGMLLGDIILSIDGQEMGSEDDLFRFLDKKQIGETVSVEVFRAGGKVKMPLKLLGSPPVNRSERVRRF
ncbi:MAG: trypsin-like peptidase domain-containing protein [Acidobacteriota bacterium]|nr:trypsin-like peptidase domain-containing protein [Acidobacteriota bacterium]MDH3529263.1 trypsin-like peptidase domain-containing protein [Acidobacteriota bacterium]